jgi:hypothetical protein
MAETNSAAPPPLDSVNKDGSEILKNSVETAKQLEQTLKELNELKQLSTHLAKANEVYKLQEEKKRAEFAKARQADVDYVLKWQTQVTVFRLAAQTHINQYQSVGTHS